MKFFYNIGIYLSQFVLRFLALFNKKLNLFVNGRKNVMHQLKDLDPKRKTIWFHCASLGEFEQGRPIIESIKEGYPTYQILLTFFSPSGYEIRKNYNLADVICYLPLDTKTNARAFVEAVNPIMAIFIKYEFWPNYLATLKIHQIKTILIAGIFRKDQLFFKGYGKWMQKSLSSFNYFFLQDQNSAQLLNSIGFNNSVIAGDTRFDRVDQITKEPIDIQGLDDFAKGSSVLVAGSTWQKDEEILSNYINKNQDANRKFIIVPHNIEASEILKLKQSLQAETALFTDQMADLSKFQVLIVDVIGLLSKVYSYGDLAYVGGGFGSGIHNILEPASFGLPIIIGPNHQKFKEANDLISIGACESVNHMDELNAALNLLFEDSNWRDNKSQLASNYIENNRGATKKIMKYLKGELND